MSKPDKTIDPRVLECAKKEFLKEGYEKASTNKICKDAGVTWGALYKRYKNKDELFCKLVSETAEEFKSMLSGVQEDFHALSGKEKERAAIDSSDVNSFIGYVYDNFDCFKLLIAHSGGSSYENYMEDLVEIVTKSTEKFMKETNHEAMILGQKAAPQMIHMLISTYLYGLFEPVVHHMSKEDALLYASQLKYFFDVGWANILKIKT